MRSFNLGHREVLSWPMTSCDLADLGDTLLVSPREGDSHGYERPSDELYTQQVKELIAVRANVERNQWPKAFMKEHLGTDELSGVLVDTLELSVRDPGNCADTVRMDHPFDIWDLVIEPWAQSRGIKLLDTPKHRGVPFMESILARATAHSMIARGLDKAFDVKYALGVCRPTEFFDPSIERYPTPNHPEMPAGHGAFCGAGYAAFELLYDANVAQKEMVEFATKQFAMFRSFSAMHIPFSNLLGWRIGYEA